MNAEEKGLEKSKKDPKRELEVMRVQIHNAEHSLQMMKAMEKRLVEMSR